MKFVTLSLLATALTVGGNAASRHVPPSSPISIILADDFGWRDLACTGQPLL